MELTSHAGHSPLSPGASGHGRKEHEVARIINSDFIALTGAVDSTSNAANQNSVLSEQVRKANASGAKLGVAWHLNAAATPAASGVEVWYYAGSADGRAYAERVSAAISGLLGIPNRGAKPSTALYWLNQTSMTAILIEVGFITNANDISLIMKHTSDIARVTAVAIGAAKPSIAPAPAPAPKAQDAVVLFHAASDVVMNLIVEAWGKGFAGYPLPAGLMYEDALSHTDALNYIPKGRSVDAMFPGADGQQSVGAIHCSLDHANKVKAYCDANKLACQIHPEGPHHVGYPSMTAALAAGLSKGIDFPAVFGVPA